MLINVTNVVLKENAPKIKPFIISPLTIVILNNTYSCLSLLFVTSFVSLKYFSYIVNDIVGNH